MASEFCFVSKKSLDCALLLMVLFGPVSIFSVVLVFEFEISLIFFARCLYFGFE